MSLQTDLAVTLAALPTPAQTGESSASAAVVPSALPPALVGPAAENGYFTDARLHQSLGVTELRKPRDVQ